MKNKVLFIILTFIFMVVGLKGVRGEGDITYIPGFLKASGEEDCAAVSNRCIATVYEAGTPDDKIYALCIDPHVASVGDTYVEVSKTENITDPNDSFERVTWSAIPSYECILKAAYFEESLNLRDDTLYNNHKLDFSSVLPVKFAALQAYVWNLGGRSDNTNCSSSEHIHDYDNYIVEYSADSTERGLVSVTLGKPSYDSSTKSYAISYEVIKKNIEAGSLVVSTNVGTLSKNDDSGILTIKVSDLEDVEDKIKITVSANVAVGEKHYLDASYTVLKSPEDDYANTNRKQVLGIPSLTRTISKTYEKVSDSKELTIEDKVSVASTGVKNIIIYIISGIIVVSGIALICYKSFKNKSKSAE